MWCSHRHNRVLVSTVCPWVTCERTQLDFAFHVSLLWVSSNSPFPHSQNLLKELSTLALLPSHFSAIKNTSSLASVSIWPLESLLSRSLMTSLLWNHGAFFFFLKFDSRTNNKKARKRKKQPNKPRTTMKNLGVLLNGYKCGFFKSNLQTSLST